MDSQSHVEYAKLILPPSHADLAVASLFPQIDRTPATLHRNYAHHLSKARPLVEIGMQFITGVRSDANNYESKRFLAEKNRILAYFPQFSLDEQSNIDFKSAILAFVSHLHLDTFNQPVQAFTPLKSVCSGQWKLWDKIGDFRYRLYVQHAVDDLRKEWLTSNIWKDKFQAEDLTAAMIHRLASLSNNELNDDIINQSFKSLNLDIIAKNHPAVEWLQEMENELAELHIRHLT